ncbi:MAG: FadR family transcriptional regulator [Rhodococcus sp.]|nr:FadR family transcriptional regulator [Rhodococcus sp. (in: high G+C Gram-positive bacteria)]
MTGVKPIRRTSLISQVTDQLRALVHDGHWEIGDRIPTEPELAERFVTGRNTVREAVQSLVHAGVLERRQGSGTFVIARSEVTSALGTYFSSAHERDVLELRQALDMTAARLAAGRRTPEDIDTLNRLLSERRALWPVDDLESAVAADVAVHRAIVAASHNAVYLEFYDSLLPAIEQAIDHHVAATGRGFHDEHASLVAAIVDGNQDGAADAARALLQEILD